MKSRKQVIYNTYLSLIKKDLEELKCLDAKLKLGVISVEEYSLSKLVIEDLLQLKTSFTNNFLASKGEGIIERPR